MIRRITEKMLDGSVIYIEAAGLSTDEKPTTGIATGSRFVEVDTGSEFLFDEESEAWTEINAAQGEEEE